ncbi:MAG: YgfZ/GcvT domain-containing protein [Alphaproteobacteria bacterium]
MTQTPYYTKLKQRGTIIISGKDAYDFLQNLISNDITLLDTQDCVYSCLLTPQGKFLYDFFITKDVNGSIIMDCEGNERLDGLVKILNMYKLRADVSIIATDNIDVFAIIGNKQGVKDPRHNDLGNRSFEKPVSLPEKPFDEWDQHRISLTIPDGSRDMIPSKSTLLEYNIDQLNGLSYEKGCYIGQELTARMHYRGLTKKILCTVTPSEIEMESLPQSGESITLNGKNIGLMRSSCNDIGLAVLKKGYIKK